MPDLYHFWGNDLSVSPTGDLATADVPTITQQRLLRRLLTNAGDDIWSLDYGAGLGSFVGIQGAAQAIRAAIHGQIFKETSVAHTPEPVIDLQADPTGSLYVHIRYADTQTGTTQTLTFTT